MTLPEHTIRVLLIEDDEVDARVILRNLDRCTLDCVAERASSPEQGKQMASNGHYDCILLDYFFPQGNAFDLFHDMLIQSCSRRPPIILLSGIGSEEIAAQSIQIGAQGYLAKSEISPWNLRKYIITSLEKGAVQKELECRDEELLKMSFYDKLTELPNRQLFLDRLAQSMYIHERENQSFAVFMMDLDLFKEVNDNFGHDVGDALLHEVGHRLSRVMRESDTVARLGGDEFAAILVSVDSIRSVETVAEKITHSISLPYNIDNKLINIGISIGIAFCPEHSADSATLMRYADIAMYEAKQFSRGYATYQRRPNKDDNVFTIISKDIKIAAENDQLVVHFQPQVDLSSGHVTGAEALVRWLHPKLKLLAPDRFIPQAERSMVIEAITLQVLNKALTQIQLCNQRGFELTISANLSARALLNESIIGHIIELVNGYDLDSRQLCLEVTETAVMQSPELAMTSLQALKDAGITLSIDDFGTGYSSLKYLKMFPIDEIKIDDEFIKNLENHSTDEKIVQAIISLGRSFNMRVVAEGIETLAAWNCLEKLNCDIGQGYYIARPLPAEDFQLWLANRHELHFSRSSLNA